MGVSWDGNKRQWAMTAPVTDVTHAVGVADGTIVDVGAAFAQATLNDNFRDLSTKVNAILAALRDAGVIAT